MEDRFEVGTEAVEDEFFDATDSLISEINYTGYQLPQAEITEGNDKEFELELLKLYVQSAKEFVTLIEDRNTRILVRLLVRFKRFTELRAVISQESEDCRNKFEEWLKEKPQYKTEMVQNISEFEGVKKPITLERVLDLISCDQRRVLLSYLISKNQWATCEKIIKTESEEAKNLFYKWKKKTFDTSLPVEAEDAHPDCIDSDSDQEASETISPDFFKRITKDEIIIAILGETGTGKSSFINAFANYINFKNPREAGRNCDVLIRGQFSQCNSNLVQSHIFNEVNVQIDQELKENDVIGTRSVTQKPICYELLFGPPGKQKKIRLIDTPGLGDTRGNFQEQTNIKYIIQHLSQYEEIDAILILMKPNESILSTSMEYCLRELLTQFPISARKNLLFGFTSTRITGYKRGDTFYRLNEFFERTRKSGIDISLVDGKNVFYFDNEPFRYLCAVQNGQEYSYATEDDINESWKRSVKEIFKLIKVISQLPKHRVKETLMMYHIKSVLMAFTKPLLDKTRELMMRRANINEAIIARESFLANDMEIPEFSMRYEPYREDFEANSFATICKASNCCKIEQIPSIDNEPKVVTEYKMCHIRCADTNIKNCYLFHSNPKRCKICGCPPEEHIHSNYIIKVHKVKVPNENFQRENETRAETKRRLTEEIESKRRSCSELIEEKKMLESYCYDFALFTKKHGIMQFNSAFKDFLGLLIDQAKNSGNNQLEIDLTEYGSRYDEQIEIIENVGPAKDRPVKTEEEIIEMIRDLREKFPDIFENIQSDETIRLLKPSQQAWPKVQIKTKPDSWFSKLC